MNLVEKYLGEEEIIKFKKGDKVTVINKGDDFYNMKGVIHRKGKGSQTVELSNGQVVSYNDDELSKNS